MTTLEDRSALLRIGLFDFEPLRVLGFESIFADQPHIAIETISNPKALIQGAFDMVLVSLGSPVDTFEILARLRSSHPSLRLIVMGNENDEETIISAIAAGAKGYLEVTASPEQVMMCIDVVKSGSIWAPRRILSTFVDRMLHSSEKPVLRHHFKFTGRERQVMRLLIAARSNKEIADTLGIEERTVKAYVGRLMRKVGVENRIALSIQVATRTLVISDEDDG